MLVLMGLALGAVKKLASNVEGQGAIYIHKGPQIEVDFNKMFDTSSARAPITITSAPNAVVHDLTHPVSKTRYSKNLELSLSSAVKINQNKVILLLKNELRVCEVDFKDSTMSQNNIECIDIDPKKDPSQISQAPTVYQSRCEDALYEASLNGYFVICREEKKVQGQESTHDINMFFKNTEGLTVEGKFKMNQFVIKNRAKLVVFKNSDTSIKDINYFNLISDTFTENGKDQPIELKLRVTSLIEFGSGDLGEYEIQDAK